MKQFIIIIATVLLAVYIGVILINGDADSLKSGASSIGNKATNEINSIEVLTNTTN